MVRRTLFSAVLVGAALALTGCAGQDSVILTGEGEIQDGSFVGVMTAFSGPSGENAGGSVYVETTVSHPPGAGLGRTTRTGDLPRCRRA